MSPGAYLEFKAIGQCAQSLLAFTQCFFALLLLGDVIVRFENALLMPAAVPIKRPAAGNYDPAAVLVSVNEFAGPAFILLKLFGNALQRLGKFGAQQLMTHATHCFLAAVAIQFGRAFVPIRDPVSRVANKDRVIAQVEQPRSFRQRLLSLLSFRDVARNF